MVSRGFFVFDDDSLLSSRSNFIFGITLTRFLPNNVANRWASFSEMARILSGLSARHNEGQKRYLDRLLAVILPLIMHMRHPNFFASKRSPGQISDSKNS